MNYNEKQNNPNYKHGGKGLRLYRIWNNMKKRTLNPNATQFTNYGGRGITICNEWLKFIPFRDWALSNGYDDSLTIDRIKNNGNYNPENCQWITQKENSRKKSTTTITIEIANEIRYLWKTGKYMQRDLAEKYSINQGIISMIV